MNTNRGIAGIASAWCFLTRVPLPFVAADAAPAIWAFPLVGAIIGAFTACILWLGAMVELPPLLAAAAAIACTVMLTGGLHEDGLADTADGFGGGRTRERKLEIMRDSRIGSYGAMALALALIAKAGAFAAFAHLSLYQLIALFAFAGATSRLWMVLLMWKSPSARAEGLSAMAGRPGAASAIVAVLITAAVGLPATIWFSHPTLVAALASFIAAVFLRWLALRQIGGQTGDICGAMQMATEIVILAAFSATLR